MFSTIMKTVKFKTIYLKAAIEKIWDSYHCKLDLNMFVHAPSIRSLLKADIDAPVKKI